MAYKHLLVYLNLLCILLLFIVLNGIKNIEDRFEDRPHIVYQADSYGGQIGKVTSKGEYGETYFVEISGYGRFLVNKEQYDVIVVGGEAQREIFERGD